MTVVLGTTTRAPDEVAAVGDHVVAPGRIATILEMQNWVAANRITTHLNLCFGATGWGAGGAEPSPGRMLFGTSSRRKFTHRYRKNADYAQMIFGIEAYVSLAGNTCTFALSIGGIVVNTFTFTSANNGTEQLYTYTDSGNGWRLAEGDLLWTVVSGSPTVEIRRIRIEEVAVSSGFPEPGDDTPVEVYVDAFGVTYVDAFGEPYGNGTS